MAARTIACIRAAGRDESVLALADLMWAEAVPATLHQMLAGSEGDLDTFADRVDAFEERERRRILGKITENQPGAGAGDADLAAHVGKLSRIGSPDLAVAFAEGLPAARRRAPAVALEHARALEKIARYREAVDVLERARAAAPGDSALARQLVASHARFGARGDALAELEGADDEWAVLRRARLLLHHNRREPAIALLAEQGGGWITSLAQAIDVVSVLTVYGYGPRGDDDARWSACLKSLPPRFRLRVLRLQYRGGSERRALEQMLAWTRSMDPAERDVPFWAAMCGELLDNVGRLPDAACPPALDRLFRAALLANEQHAETEAALAASGFATESAMFPRFNPMVPDDAYSDTAALEIMYRARAALTPRAEHLLTDCRRTGRALFLAGIHGTSAYGRISDLPTYAAASLGIRTVVIGSLNGAGNDGDDDEVEGDGTLDQFLHQHLPVPPTRVPRDDTSAAEQASQAAAVLREGGMLNVVVDFANRARDRVLAPWILVPLDVPVFSFRIAVETGARCAALLCYRAGDGRIVLDMIEVPMPPAGSAVTRARWLTQRFGNAVRRLNLECQAPIRPKYVRRWGGLPVRRDLVPVAGYLDRFPEARHGLVADLVLSARRDPDGLALFSRRGALRLGDLRDASLRLTALLMHYQGICARHSTPERPFSGQHRVLFALPAEAALLAGTLAASLAGSLWAIVDPGETPAKVAARLERLRPDLVIATAGFVDRHGALLGQDIALLIVDDAGDAPALADITQGFAPATELPPYDADLPQCVVFTSGSTGTPVGVVLSGAVNDDRRTGVDALFGVGASDRAVFLARWDTVNMPDILTALRGGACLFLPPPETVIRPALLRDYLDKWSITFCSAPASLWHALTAAAGPEGPASSLRFAFLWGERISVPLMRAVRARFPDARLCISYGASEATYIATRTMDEVVVTATTGSPGGFPTPGTVLRLLDDEDRPIEARGVSGRIEVASGNVMLGKLDDLMARTDPFAAVGIRVLCPGDHGMWGDDGSLVVLGRRDSIIKVGGRRFSLSEIERAAETVPGVRRALALPGASADSSVPDLAVETDLDVVEEVRRAIAETVGAVVRPRRVLALPEFPRMATGKVNRAALGEMMQGGSAPLPVVDGDAGGAVARIDAAFVLDHLLSWARRENVAEPGAETRLDGNATIDSIMMLEMILSLEDALGTRLPAAALGQSAMATFGGFAAAVASSLATP
ncbi:AMP-binding protein [Zavarzinia compransoris]|uniref:AMP-binding protein n=1 Tax=Zavarzinia marina TaxID=2911065 RepID=UPI001F337CAE|nr:AMP-binding protein [Zavarzinia marina]MCF4167669.1 AMP-binding protein [Zavarzinia marina]